MIVAKQSNFQTVQDIKLIKDFFKRSCQKPNLDYFGLRQYDYDCKSWLLNVMLNEENELEFR